MLKFISRAGKSAMRGLLPRDVKRNTLDNPIGLEACNMQQFWRTQPLFLFGFESQRSLASSKFASRARIFEAFLNPWEPRKNSFFLWVFRNFQKRFPFQENNYEAHFLQDRKPQWRNGEGAPPGEGGTPAPLSSWPQWTKCSSRISDLVTSVNWPCCCRNKHRRRTGPSIFATEHLRQHKWCKSRIWCKNELF